MARPFYVTTPIYYVNDSPHIGHAYTSLAADMMARFARLQGRDVKFLTGTDEHGQKVEKSAENAGKTPQDFVDEVSQRFRVMSERLQLTHDDFIRTTEPRHIKAAQALWTTLIERDEIYKGTYAGWYAIRDEAFYQEAELIDGKAPTGALVEWVEEESYFFRLSKWEKPLLAYFEAHPDFMGPTSRRNEVTSFVTGGLRDLSVSRSTFKWGVPVPGDAGHVMYVWLDALTNYLTALDYPAKMPTSDGYWGNSLHLVGKDILRFHCVYWPAFLMAAGLPVPKRVYAHGWLTNAGAKISKSVGNAIDPMALIDTFGLDQFRYFFLREVPFGKDGEYSETAFIQRINSDLANDLGNLVQRVLAFIQKHAGAEIPPVQEFTADDAEILGAWKGVLAQMTDAFETQALHRLCEHLWTLVGDANRYIDLQQPWSLRKTDTARMGTVLYTLTEVIRHIGILAQPIVPLGAAKILETLGVPLDARQFTHLETHPLQSGVPLPVPTPIFPRFQKQETSELSSKDTIDTHPGGKASS